MENVSIMGELELTLNRCKHLLEAAPVIRKDAYNRDVLVVYAVPASLESVSTANLTLNELLAASDFDTRQPVSFTDSLKQLLLLPSEIILLNAIPRDQDGSVDKEALASIEVTDNSVMQNWTDAVQSIPTIEKVAVLNAIRHCQPEYLHKRDIINEPFTSSSFDSHEHASSGSQSSSAMHAVEHETALAEVHAAGTPLTDRLDNDYELSLSNTLRRAVKTSPDKGIHFINKSGDKSFLSYPQLYKSAQALSSGLHADGLKKGDKVILQCDNNSDFLTVFWACVIGGIVPVSMSVAPKYTADNAVVQKLLNIWQMLEQPVIVCSNSMVDDFRTLIKETELCNQHVIPVSSLQNCDIAQTSEIERLQTVSEVSPDDLSLLLLTSGSTGTPKAVMHTHRTLINRSAATTVHNDFGRNDISLNWMPLDHVGGIVMFHLRDVYNACSQIQVATSWILESPLRWLDIIDAYKATITWAPNFAFGLIVDRAEEISRKKWDLSPMRFILNGGEAVVAHTARRFIRLLEKHQLPVDSMHPAWGMSETASGVCYSHNFSLETVSDSDSTVEVGSPIPNTSLRIVDSNNHVLHEGQRGILQIRGASITPGYYANPQANKEAFTDDGWFKTGDAGILNQGHLTITDRVKDEIIINGINYPAVEIEAITESIKGIETSYTAACAVRKAISDTDGLAVFFSPSEGDIESLSDILKTIHSSVATSAGIKPDFIIPLSKQQIPKTNIGKIQRALLKNNFEQGKYDEQIKQSEQLLGTNLVQDWFFKKQWIPKNLTAHDRFITDIIDSENNYLVFCDDAGFGAALCSRLGNHGVKTVTVSAGDSFGSSMNNAFKMNPYDDTHYQSLMQTLSREGFYPDVIVHCWTYVSTSDNELPTTLPQKQGLGVYSILGIIQALTAINTAEKQTALYAVSADVQQFMNESTVFNPHGAVTGILKSAPYELSWLSTHHIDFDFYQSESELAGQADSLLAEINTRAYDDEIIYRQGKRYGWQLLPGIFTSQNLSSCKITPGSIYLITGGLGGIGSYLAHYLLTHFKAQLILVGRSHLPERDQWSDIVKQGGRSSEHITRYLRLEQTEGEFTYSSVDLTDGSQLRKMIDDAEQRWNEELAGVFHLAAEGDIGSRWQQDAGYTIAEESQASYECMFTPKVYASWTLANLVSQRNKTFLLSFGSVIGAFGAARYASYAAAHTFLSQMTEYFNQQQPGRFFQFNWAVWEDIGLSANEPSFAHDYYRSIGYSIIPASIGMDCLLAGMCHREADIIIGLDPDKWPIRRHLPFENQSLKHLVACHTTNANDTSVESAFKTIEVHDRFHHPSQCEIIQFENMPVTTDGDIDREKIQAMLDTQPTEDDDQPVTDIEKQVAACWCEVMNIHAPGKHTSFFQLGGNSLTATLLISRLKHAFGINLDMRDIFDAATITDLAELINTRLEQSTKQQSTVTTSYGFSIDTSSAHELLANIDQLSDEQVTKLLSAMEQKVKLDDAQG